MRDRRGETTMVRPLSTTAGSCMQQIVSTRRLADVLSDMRIWALQFPRRHRPKPFHCNWFQILKLVALTLIVVKGYGHCRHGNCRAHIRIPNFTAGSPVALLLAVLAQDSLSASPDSIDSCPHRSASTHSSLVSAVTGNLSMWASTM